MPEVVVLWSDKAKRTYSDIIEYLNSRWTKKEIHNFISRTDTVINKIIETPYIFKQYKNNPLIRQAVLHKTVMLIYRLSTDGRTIHIVTFWGTRQNPKNLKITEQ
jgi:plasmid stabilization system protein ParE